MRRLQSSLPTGVPIDVIKSFITDLPSNHLTVGITILARFDRVESRFQRIETRVIVDLRLLMFGPPPVRDFRLTPVPP